MSRASEGRPEYVWGTDRVPESERDAAAAAFWSLPDEEPVLVQDIGWVPWGELKAELLRRNELEALGVPWTPQIAAPPQRMGFVYIIGTVEGPPRFKLGFAGNPEQRFANIQAMSPVKLRIVATFRGTIEMERRAHKALSDHRLHGEWFSVSGLEEAKRLLGAVE